MGIKRLLLLLLALAVPVHAQFLGYVSEQTVQTTAFTAQAANGFSPTFANIGQSAHYLTYCPTAFVGTISLVASTDGTFATPIPLAQANYNTATSKCKVLPVGGYYPALRAQISNYGSGSISAFYYGVASPVAAIPAAVNSAGPTTPVQCDQQSLATITAGGTALVASATAAQNIWICSLTYGLLSAPTSAGFLDLVTATNAACTTGTTVIWFAPLLQTTPLQPFFAGGTGAWITVPPNLFVCLITAAMGASVDVTVTFAQGFTNP